MLKFPLWNNFCCPVGREGGKKKKKHLQQDGRREGQARTTHPKRGKPCRSLDRDARELTGKDYISQEEYPGKFCGYLSHQSKSRRQ